ncbi:MAG: hypothetical protein H6562_12405 [Lewinellaceae bacterium]|nr:hypothetical protein [Lewinella sp.]MCB9279713.1 hypothetical protein [Lewinellaceae bacterium]
MQASIKISAGIFALMILFSVASCDLAIVDPVPGSTGNATKFQTTIGGNGNDFPADILANADGSFVVVGYSQSFTAQGDNQAYIAKLDSKGNLLWEKDFGGPADDYAQAVTAAADGGYVFCGRTRSFNPNNNDDLFLVKVNSAGAKVWEKNYGATDTTEYAFGIIPVGTGDFLVAYRASIGNNQYIKTVKINGNGSKKGADKILRTGFIYPQKMIKTRDGKAAIAGTESIAGSGSAAYILKLTEDGSFVWEKSFPEQSPNFSPAYALAEMANNDLILAGSDLGSNDHDFMMVRYSGIGAREADKIWGGANADELLAVTAGDGDEVAVAGYTGSFSGKNEIYLSKRKAADGALVWEKHFLESWVQAIDVEWCPDGGLVVCTGQNAANADIIIVKTDAQGNFQ